MTNAEKYLKEGIEVREIWHKYQEFLMNNDKTENACTFVEFFEEKVQPTLTEDERVILRHLKGFYYIYRTTTGELEATNKEHTWCAYELYFDDDVFQFIKERRRIRDKGIIGGEMSYRIYVNHKQVLGNNECPEVLIKELEKQGCTFDADKCFDDFEIKDLQAIIEALEQYIYDIDQWSRTKAYKPRKYSGLGRIS